MNKMLREITEISKEDIEKYLLEVTESMLEENEIYII